MGPFAGTLSLVVLSVGAALAGAPMGSIDVLSSVNIVVAAIWGELCWESGWASYTCCSRWQALF